MALITARFPSRFLHKQVELHALIPDSGQGPFPVYYLLHGGGDDSSNWMRYSRIELHHMASPFIVVMPDGYFSFYVDHHNGPAYARYMLEDVIGFVDRTFDTIPNRSSRCIGGLSMGGYGALYLALSHPDLFCSVNSTAGCFGFWGEHLKQWGMPLSEEYLAPLRQIHGPRMEGSDLDLFALAKKFKASPTRALRMRLDCGRSDSLLAANRAYDAHLTTLGMDHEYAEAPGGHNWDYFDSQIPDALAFHSKSLSR